MTNITNFSDIIENNGKTVRDNNIQKKHNIPIGTLCEFVIDEWFGGGACMAGKFRLYVIEHNRDCDGTPLYSLSKHKPDHYVEGDIIFTMDNGSKFMLKEEISFNILNEVINGVSEDQLTPIEVTQDIIDGKGSLSREDLE